MAETLTPQQQILANTTELLQLVKAIRDQQAKDRAAELNRHNAVISKLEVAAITGELLLSKVNSSLNIAQNIAADVEAVWERLLLLEDKMAADFTGLHGDIDAAMAAVVAELEEIQAGMSDAADQEQVELARSKVQALKAAIEGMVTPPPTA